MAVDQFGADWVVPLDADEFVEPADGEMLAEALAERDPQLFSLSWSNFVWAPEGGDDLEPNPVLRLRLRLQPRSDCTKLIVPARLVDESVQLAQGNHELLRDGKALPAMPLDTVQLCHFPIRDPLQYAGKIAIGYLKYAALAGWTGDWGFHYIEPFHALSDGGLQGLSRRMPADSRSYSLSKDAQSGEPPEAREQPLTYKGGPITLASSRQTLLSNVLHYAEALSKELAAGSGRQPAAAAELDLARREQAIAMQSSQQLAQDKAVLEKRLSALSNELATSSSREQATAVELELSRREQAIAVQGAQQLAEDKAALEKRLSKLELELLAAREVVFVQSERLSSRTYRLLDRLHGRLANAGLSPRALVNGIFWLLRIR